MGSDEKKAAGMLDTPATADITQQKLDHTSDSLTSNCNKQVATLTAQFALRGFAVHSLAEGGWLVERWGLVRHCRDITALQEFSVQVGAASS